MFLKLQIKTDEKKIIIWLKKIISYHSYIQITIFLQFSSLVNSILNNLNSLSVI